MRSAPNFIQGEAVNGKWKEEFRYQNFDLKNMSLVYEGVYYEEQWCPIIDLEELYHVSNFGRVKALPVTKLRGRFYSFYKARIMKQKVSTRGYLTLELRKNSKSFHFLIHRLVARHFISNGSNKPEVNHIDGEKRNNFYKNLEWATALENKTHAIANGLINTVGVNNGRAKVTPEMVKEIRSKYIDKIYSAYKLAKEYNVCETQIQRIVKGQAWNHVL